MMANTVLTDEQRQALAEAIVDFGEQVATHTGEAIGAIEEIEDLDILNSDIPDEQMALAISAATLEVQRAGVHALLAIGLRLEVLTSLLTAFAMPDLAPDSRLEE